MPPKKCQRASTDEESVAEDSSADSSEEEVAEESVSEDEPEAESADAPAEDDAPLTVPRRHRLKMKPLPKKKAMAEARKKSPKTDSAFSAH